MRSGHRGHKDQGTTPVSPQGRHCLCQTQVRNVDIIIYSILQIVIVSYCKCTFKKVQVFTDQNLTIGK